MTTLIKYTTADFKKIQSDGFSYELPEYSMALINSISNKVGAPSYIKTPVFRKSRPLPQNTAFEPIQPIPQVPSRSNKTRGNHGGGRELNDEEWENIRSFETTKIDKAKDELELTLKNIRGLLNKLSDATYSTIKEEFMFMIMELQENKLLDIEHDENNLWKNICELIINTSCSNAFYSGQYVKLLKDISHKYNSITRGFTDILKKCMDGFYTIRYTDPEVNYDEYCKNNLDNKRRRALSTFVCNLYSENMINETEYTTIVYTLIDTFEEYIEKKNEKNVCEEFSELIFSTIEKNYKNLLDIDSFQPYFKKMKEFSVMSTKQHSSLTNKAVFKFCDIIDEFQDVDDD